jgi:hypothetical protein
VSPALIAVAVAVGAGAIIAVSSRDPRAAFIGLAMVLVGASFLVDPLPAPGTLGVRIVGGLLCIAILRLAASDRDTDATGSPLGWPAEAFLAIAAAVGGGGIALSLAVKSGNFQSAVSREAIAAAVSSPAIAIIATAAAVMAIGLTPALLGRAGFGRTVGLVLVTVAVTLLRIGFAGAPNDMEQIAIAGLLVGGAAGGVGLARAAVAASGRAADAGSEAASATGDRPRRP